MTSSSGDRATHLETTPLLLVSEAEAPFLNADQCNRDRNGYSFQLWKHFAAYSVAIRIERDTTEVRELLGQLWTPQPLAFPVTLIWTTWPLWHRPDIPPFSQHQAPLPPQKVWEIVLRSS